MTNRELLKQIYLLREKAESNKLIVFVGAGVSRNVAGMPSWSELVMEMAKSIGYSKCKACRHHETCHKRCSECQNKDKCDQKCLSVDDFSVDDYLKIPQYVFNQKQQTYSEIIERCIKDRSVPTAPLSKAIFELNPAHIITTNYDRLLETSESEFRTQYEVVISDSDLLNAEKSKYIIKMHGDVLHPETIVLKEQDYLQYSQNHILIELFIKALLADHTILFLGYSLNDYNVKLIVSWINYLRSQSKSLLKQIRIGYLVLDEDEVDKNTITYFRKNNIEVLNIHTLHLVEDIPDELSEDRGKRLYSFLKIISNPALEEGISSRMSMETAVSFLKQHHISDYTLLLKFLHIDAYSKTDYTLTIRSEKQYFQLKEFLDSDEGNAATMKQLLIDADISVIRFSAFGKDESYRIIIGEEDVQTPSQYYSLYLENRYSELLNLLKSVKTPSIEKGFYLHFLTGYMDIEKEYTEIDYEGLSIDDAIVYFNNVAAIDALKHFRFDSSRVTHYINNITDSKVRQVFQPFLDMYSGNTDRRLRMATMLDKLKANIKASTSTVFSGGSIAEIYNIKNYAVAQYKFFFINHVFILGFNDASTFFRPYIEALLYASSVDAEQPGIFMGIPVLNEKYNITAFDFDILSKFIAAKDLYALIKSINVKQFRTSESVIRHLTSCFVNLADSLVESETFGYRDSSITVLVNLALLLTRIPLAENEKGLISKSIQSLFSSTEFNIHFWRIDCPDFRFCIKIIADLCKQIDPIAKANCIVSIVNSPRFFEYCINVDFNAVRSVLNFLTPNENCEAIEKIIDGEKSLDKKIILLRLFYKKLDSSKKVSTYKSFLSNNFSKLSTHAIYDFTFNNWLDPTNQDISELFFEVLSLYRNKDSGIHSFPDPLNQKLECIYILYISGKIESLNALDELSEDYPHLCFLLHPEAFDYKTVDFTNYMWVNFARHEKYMAEFIDHRDDITPSIKDRIRSQIATDTEKKILYGFLLHGSEIWEKD